MLHAMFERKNDYSAPVIMLGSEYMPLKLACSTATAFAEQHIPTHRESSHLVGFQSRLPHLRRM